ncbi:MAG: ribosome silencing factor [Muribaculaceae bacterium]|nr:ribosome silencing factor [Muribaculaceae bacterium]
MAFNQDIIDIITEGIQEKKGRGITIIGLSGIDMASTGAFVVCEGRSPSQVSAIADSVREHVQKATGRKPLNYDGYRNSQWIIVDYGEVMLHVFLPETRQYYNLEDLWADAEICRLPDLD